MSYTTLYKVPESGPVETFAEFRNAFQSAYHVWDALAQRYLGKKMLDMMFGASYQPLWDLARDPRLTEAERVVHYCTFDRAMVRREFIPNVIAAYREFAQTYGAGTLLEQADALTRLMEDPAAFACCWQQNSVSEDVWFLYGEDDDESRPFDLSRDSDREGHEPLWVDAVIADWRTKNP